MAECGGINESKELELEELRQRLSETINFDDNTGCFGRPGSQLDDKLEFKSRDGNSVWAYPVLVDFQRLLQLGQVTENSGIIPGVSNQDLLHAVAGLYDVCLSDMSASCIYDTISEKWARTIVLVRDIQDTLKDMKEHRIRKQEKARKEKEEKEKEAKEDESEEEEEDDEGDEEEKEIDPENDYWSDEEEAPSKFEAVFSDTEDEEEDDDEEDDKDEDDEPNFTKGVCTFIKNVQERRKARKAREEEGETDIRPELVGIENMIMGCASFEKKFVCQKRERVIHLTFIGVRRRARKLQMGRYLLSKCLDPTVVGHYEAVVVHADNNAVDFFTKFGFTSDLLLNSKWSELAEEFTQCTLMSYLPGFSLSGTAMMEVSKTLKQDPEVGELEAEFKKWQEKSLEAYQSQVLCMKKMQHEILQLKCVMKKQSELMDKLLEDNELMRKNKLVAERELLTYRLETARSAFKAVSGNGDVGVEISGDLGDDINTDQLISSLERQVTLADTALVRLSGTPQTKPSAGGDKDGYSITGGHVRSQTSACDQSEDMSSLAHIVTQFKQAMSADLDIQMQYEVSNISKAALSIGVREKFQIRASALADPSMVTQLFFCGTLEKPHRCQEVLNSGFSAEDFSHGDYGHGLYFSKYPSKAAQFSTLGKLLVVEVGLGRVETVTKEDRTRKGPAAGFDSIITPGRLHRPQRDSVDVAMCQEYVIFNPAQVLPLCLLSYQAASQPRTSAQ